MKYLLFSIKILWDLKWLYVKAYVVLYLMGLVAKSTLTYTELAMRIGLISLAILIIGIALNYEKVKVRWENET